MWIYDSSGTLSFVDEAPVSVSVDPDHADNDLLRLGANQTVAISFGSFADGRGFSLARKLREAHGDAIRLIATGHVLPDQARHSFSSGFDQILISDENLERFGREAWTSALQNSVDEIYLGQASSEGVWAHRHQTNG